MQAAHALREAHEAAEQRTAAAMQEVRGELGARLQAEQSLLRRLQLQHGQQGALEDKGVRLLHAHTRHITVTLPLQVSLLHAHTRHMTVT